MASGEPRAQDRRPAEPAAAPRIDVHDPHTGDLIGSVPAQGPTEVAAAIDAARDAFGRWGALPFAVRAARLLAVRDRMLDRIDDITASIVAETGKLPEEALVHEVAIVADLIGYHARHGERALRPERARVGMLVHKRAMRLHQPLGVIGVISPWNYPFMLAMTPVVTALAAGSTVVVKPSEVTPRTGQLLAELFAPTGPDDPIGAAVQVVTGGGATGDALVRGGVDLVCFTGSTATGRRVMAAAADTLTPVVLELGGKDPMIVCADADVHRAAAGAVWGAFQNSGQACVSVERVYVEAPVYEEFVAHVVHHTRALRQGSGPGTDVGAMTVPTQIDLVERHLVDAQAKGARVLTGGRRVPGHSGLWFEPTVLVDVDHEMTIMREETFGPVLPIMQVGDADEAVALANDSEYGLAASVWTADGVLAAELARRVQASQVCINDVATSFGVADLPLGGVKHSGIGRLHGRQALRDLSAQKSVLVDRFGFSRELWWYPVPRLLGPFTRVGLVLRYRRGLGAKLAALRRRS
jgi:acyl-CoA reductase-like NAD-dependent aldehyde dehydrogenase